MTRFRPALLLAVALSLAGPAQSQTSTTVADSVCVSVIRPGADSASRNLLSQCLKFWNTLPVVPSGSSIPAPLPGTGKKAQAVAAMDSARYYSRVYELVDSARFDLTDTSSTRPNSQKLASAVAQIQSAMTTYWDQVKAWLTRALTLLDATVPTVPPPVPPDTSTVPVPVPPTGPPGVVQLPRAVPYAPPGLAVASCTKQVTSNLQSALDAASAGDVICLTGVFNGNFTLPARSDTGWVVVRSNATGSAPGTRITPATAAGLAEVRASGTAPAFQTAATAGGWYLRELNVSADSGLTSTVYSVVNIVQGSHDVWIDRVWVHPPQDRQNQRCVAINGARVAVVESWLGECHGKGFDSQAIILWNSPGVVLIRNNTLSGAGENFMVGGADPNVQGLVPSDITFVRNHVYTPSSWRGKWTKKNLLETKNVRRLLIEENVFEGSWGDGQTGFAIVLKSANQSGNCRWCGTHDVTVRRNLIKESAASFDINGRGGDLGMIDSVSSRILIEQNYSSTGGAVGIDGRHFKINTGVVDLTLRRNTYTKTPLSTGNVYTGSDKGTVTAVNLIIDHDLAPFANYGVMGQWSPTTSPPGVVNLQVLGLGVWGPKAATSQLPGMTKFSTEADGLAAGFGVARSVVEAATAGVVVLP